MVRKKHICLFVSLLLLLASFPLTAIGVQAESDVSPPTLVSIDIDKLEVTSGDTVKITAEVEDDISGVQSVQMIYKSPSSVDKWLSLKLNNEGKYEGTITIEENAAEGEWTLWFLRIDDQVGNAQTLYSEDLPNSINYNVTGTTSDVNPPTLNSIELDKLEVTSGETIKITAEVEDDISGVQSVQMIYKTPSSVNKWVLLELNNEGKYEGIITIKENDAEGEWTLWFLQIDDQIGNAQTLYSEDIPNNINFNVTGTTSDVNPPTLKSIDLDKREVTGGDKIKIIAEVEDDISGVQSVQMIYKSPSLVNKWILLELNNEGKYEGVISIVENDAEGEWVIDFVEVRDQTGNYKFLYEKDMPNNINFIVTEKDSTPLPITSLTETFITTNTSWSNQTIEGDLYVGPNAVLTIDGSVTVTGNIYVLGAVKNYGDLHVSGTIFAHKFNWGSSTLDHGTVLMLGGTNSIGGMNASNQPISDMPLTIEPEILIAENGIIPTLDGVTLPIMDLYVEGNKVEVSSNGTFQLEQIAIGDKQNVTFEFIDVFGNHITKEFPVKVVETQPSLSIITGSLKKGTEAIADVWVSARTVEGDTWYDTKTNSEGNFEFNFPDGEYLIQGIWVDEEAKWYENPIQFKVANGQLEGTEGLDINLLTEEETKSTLNGYVNKGIEAIPNVWVSAKTVDGDVWYDTITDADGKFVFDLPDGEYIIQGIWIDDEGKWYEKPTQFKISNGQLGGSIELGINLLSEEETLTTVTGQVTKGTEAVSDVWVSAKTVEGDIWYDTKTDTEGKFAFNLPDGEYVIQGIWVDTDSKWYEKTIQFKILNGQLEGSTELGLDLLSEEETATTVTGQVTKGTETVSDVWVSAKTVEGDIWYDTKTDTEGKFAFNLLDGEYVIQGIWVDADNKWYEKPTQFKIINGQLEGSPELGINLLSEEEAPSTVAGQVTKGTKAVSHIWVSARTVEGDRWYDTKTDAEGKFKFEVPDGEYIIQGIWIDEEAAWYEKPTQFKVINGQLEGIENVQIDL